MSAAFDRADELLVQQATEGLPVAETEELGDLLARHPGLEADRYELAAAAIQLAVTRIESMPAHVRQRLEIALPPRAGTTRPARLPASFSPWYALAAMVAIAFVGWLVVRPPSEPSTLDRREQLLATAPDLVRVDWTATEDSAAVGASGDVVWSNELQSGFMRFRGLAVNDPRRTQYQLWVFDADRDERYPVDGGVFDIPAGQDEVVVPIDPKILVHRPTLFAVTIEPPGGVVVSTRERIVVVAQL
jgi:anti-sigma-K factor RskA